MDKIMLKIKQSHPRAWEQLVEMALDVLFESNVLVEEDKRFILKGDDGFDCVWNPETGSWEEHTC